MKRFLTIIHILAIQTLFSQKILNGSFESNSATGDLINLSNADLNAKLRNVTSFGSYGDVDIINSGSYGGGGAQHGAWYIALTAGGTDIVALELSAPMKKGKVYTLSFYDRKDARYNATPMVIGVSNFNNTFGTTVYVCPEAAIGNTWTKRTFTFTADNNEQYITVQMAAGGIGEWVNVDNFSLEEGKLLPVVTETVTVIEPKKDSVVAKIIEKRDTVVTDIKPHKYVKFNKHKLNGRKYKIQESLMVSDAAVKLVVWDKNTVDGDIVSIYLNGELLEENLEVTKNKKEISINLQTGRNVIVMYALNLGRIPPNTAAIGLTNNKHRFVTLVSDLKKSGALEIIYDPYVMAMK